MGQPRRRGRAALAVAGSVLGLLGLLTRVTASGAARTFVREDGALMQQERMGPAIRYQLLYSQLDSISAEVATAGPDGKPRVLGVATSWGPLVSWVTPPARYKGVNINTQLPLAERLDSKNHRTPAFSEYLRTLRTVVFVVSSDAIRDADRGALRILWRHRTLKAEYVDADVHRGIAILVATLDDGRDEDPDKETDEDAPFVASTNLRISEGRDFVVVRGAEGGRRRGFSYVPVHGVTSPSDLAIDGAFPASDAGAAVGYGFKLGSDPELIGLMLTPGRFPTGAVPIVPTIDVARAIRLAATSLTDRTPTTAFLGVTLSSAAEDGPDHLGTDLGAVAVKVDPSGPASRHGMLAGDRIVSVAGTAVANRTELQAAIRARHPGDQVTLDIIRQGASVSLAVTLATFPES